MGETTEDKNRIFEPKDNNHSFLTDKLELFIEKSRKQKEKVNLEKIS